MDILEGKRKKKWFKLVIWKECFSTTKTWGLRIVLGENRFVFVFFFPLPFYTVVSLPNLSWDAFISPCKLIIDKIIQLNISPIIISQCWKWSVVHSKHSQIFTSPPWTENPLIILLPKSGGSQMTWFDQWNVNKCGISRIWKRTCKTGMALSLSLLLQSSFWENAQAGLRL